MSQYNFKKTQDNWRDKWFDNNLYEAKDFSPKPKKYILAELPYPSGAQLHAGHIMRYTVPDVYSRYLRMKGFNVLFPMGWDAFGLPAENYAIKTGVHPEVTTKKAIAAMKESLKQIGYGIDWTREVSSADPEYYKWTQWLFLKFYENGLAELKEMPVWWDDVSKTVLADEEILTTKEGVKISERGGNPVIRRNLKQWVLKIPQYAEKLIAGLETVDYPDAIKNAQMNWIGKSDGANIDFKIDQQKVTVFTTRIDTIYGATFLVLSPEHPLVDQITSSEQSDIVKKYQAQAKNKSDMERTETKDKTGVFTGAYAENPFSHEKLPVWIGDFVVMSYGTGALMAVPAHDARDFEFATKFNLPIKQVIKPTDDTKVTLPYSEDGILTSSDVFDNLTSSEAQQKMTEQAENQSFGSKKTNYKMRDWIFSRQRYWGEPIPLIFVEPDGHTEEVLDLPVILPSVPDYTPSSDATSPLARNTEWVSTKSKDGSPAKRETNTMPNWAGSCWYFLRYLDPHNDKEFASMDKLKYWMPVDRYFGGAEHTTMHLLYSRFWYQFFFDIGLVPNSEPYQWRLNGGLLLGPDGRKMSKSIGNVIDPMTIAENYGADALRTFICFIGPYTDTYPYNENGVRSCWRLMKNIYELKDKVTDGVEDTNVSKAYNKMVKNITSMFEDLKMNTSVSEIMIFTNQLKDVEKIDSKVWNGFLRVLAPLAPFLAEELWQELNHYTEWKNENSVHVQPWPEFDEKILENETITIAVQVNGKVREQIEISPNESEDSVKQKVMLNENVLKWTQFREVVKFIYIPNKIVSIVTN